MRVVLAPDKFKASLSAVQACQAMSRGVLRACPDALVELVPMADGGEGTVEALLSSTGGSWVYERVSGPLGDPVDARFGLSGDGKTALIEMASASGLVLLPPAKRDPLRSSTRGTGELLRSALDRGVERVILAIGGSATNDGGAGLAQALGYRLLDAEDHPIGPGGGALDALDRIDSSHRHPRLGLVEIVVACDVQNPLCGPQGASAVYGPQKGATPEDVQRLDRNLSHFARIILRDLGSDVADVPGAGAAGGLGAGLLAFAGATLRPGFDLVLEASRLHDRLQSADLCLTGEGALDASTAYGKTVAGVGKTALRAGCPVLALVGLIAPGVTGDVAAQLGLDAVFSLARGPISLEESIANAEELLESAAEQATRSFLVGRRGKPPTISGGPALGEFELIARIRSEARPGAAVRLGIGDDCAVIPSDELGDDWLVTTDMLLDGRHFHLRSCGPEAVGYKALGVNLSDIAAMAGQPTAAFVSVALPRWAASDIGLALLRGMKPLADLHGVVLAGGDTNAWDGPLVINVALLGKVRRGQAVTRSGARPGDVVFVTGPLGGSLLGRHLRPNPRIREAQSLAASVDLHAMIDLSDGLASDLRHILHESGGLGALLDAQAIPIHEDAVELSRRDGRSSLEHALTDGEDFELCFVVSAADAKRLQALPPAGVSLYRIGSIEQEQGIRIQWPDREPSPLLLRGFDHLSPSGNQPDEG